MRKRIRITDDQHDFTEEMGDDVREHYVECIGNGANPDLEMISFSKYTQSLMPFPVSEIERYNGNHFIYGWWESFRQTMDLDDCFNQWMKSDKIKIAVEPIWD